MKPLFTAINDRFIETTNGAHNEAYLLLEGRLFNGSALPDTPHPYAIFFIVSGVEDGTSTEEMDDVLMQFSIYDDQQSASRICDIYEALKDLYHDCKLMITGHNLVHMHRSTHHLIPRDKDGIWEYVQDFNILTEKIG